MDIQTKEKTIKIIDKAALFFFAVLIFFLPISNAAIESCFGFIFLCFIIKAAIIRPSLESVKHFFSNRINLSLLIFYICIGLTIFVSGPYMFKSFKAWFFKWGEGVLLFYFAQSFFKKRHIKILIYVFLFSACLLSIDGLYQKYTGVDFLRGFPAMKGDSDFLGIKASFNHYNGFATFLVAVFFITSGFMLYIKRFYLKLPLLVLSFLIVANLLLTYSRGAWLAFLVVSFLLATFLPSAKQRMFFSLFVAVFAMSVICVPFLKERFLLILKSGGDADRLEVWKLAFAMFRDSPLFGKGIGSFMYYFPIYDEKNRYFNQYAHNCYLQILAETGLLGLLSFLWFLGEIIRTGFTKLKSRAHDSLLLGLYSAFLAFLIHMFFDTQLYSLKLAILFWLLVSFIAVCLLSDSASKN